MERIRECAREGGTLVVDPALANPKEQSALSSDCSESSFGAQGPDAISACEQVMQSSVCLVWPKH